MKADEDEIQAYREAYMQLFAAVLTRKGGAQEAREALLVEMRTYLEELKSKDDFLSGIPSFAARLNVGEQSLSTFIGGNFRKALQNAKTQLAKKGPSESTAQGKTILSELINRFGDLTRGKFEELDYGVLKLVNANGEIPGKSFYAFSGESPPAPVVAETNAVSKTISSTENKQQPSSATQTVITLKESSIIGEILTRFGNILDIHEKLVPSDGLVESDGVEVADVEPAALTPELPQNTNLDQQTATVKKESVIARERSIIKEILEKFGNILDIHEKLEPSTGMELTEAETMAASQPAITKKQGEAVEEFVEPIPFGFHEYIDAMKKLSDFTARKDAAGYKQWLSSAGPGAKGLIALRNIQARTKGAADWETEYYDLSFTLNVKKEQVAELHTRLKQYRIAQDKLSEFMNHIRSSHPSIQQSVKKVWPELKEIMNQNSDLEGYITDCKFVMLQIPEQQLREKILELLKPLLSAIAT